MTAITKPLLQAKVDRLKKLLQAEFQESIERGMELSKLRGMILGYKHLLPEAVFKNPMVPVASYEKRCTKRGKCEKKKRESP